MHIELRSIPLSSPSLDKDPKIYGDTPPKEKKAEHIWQWCQHFFSLKSPGKIAGSVSSLPGIFLNMIKRITMAISAIFHSSHEMDPDMLLSTFFDGEGLGNTADKIRQNLQGDKRTEVYASGKKLKAIPVEILGLSHDLTDLDLSSNDFESLPDWIGKFEVLLHLNLASNHLKTLTSGIGPLRRLAYLCVEDNDIEELPDVFASLDELQQLILDKNKLKSIPPTVCTCTALEQILCSQNGLAELPERIGALTKLRVLNCSGNQISCVPASIINCSELTYLNLSHNRLEAFPSHSCNLANLETLSLAYNDLTGLPPDFSPPLLSTLDLSHNRFEEFPSVLFGFKKLRKLIIDQDRFAAWSVSLRQLQQDLPKVTFWSPDIPPQQLLF